MKIFLLFASFIAGTTFADAQSLGDLKMPLPPLIDRYRMDYEIVGMQQPTPELLENLSLDEYEELRLTDQSVEIYDEVTGYTIILYSVDRAIANYTNGRSAPGISDE